MNRLSVRTILPIGILLLLSLPLLASAQEEEPPARIPAPARFVTLSLGPTTSSGDKPGLYERVLFEPPDGDALTTGDFWEISMDLATELGRKGPSERWGAIRRNLGLAPDDRTDLVLWREVVDDLLAMLGTLTEGDRAAGSRPSYGLRVAFPGNATVSESSPDVALTFDPGRKNDPKKPDAAAADEDAEERLIGAMLKAVTGVEGSIRLVGPDGSAVAGDWLSKFPDLTIRLRDGEGNEKGVMRIKDHPSYAFSRLTGVPDLGGDYWLEMTGGGAGSPWGENEPERYVPAMEAQYVPVRPGMRTRQHLTLKLVEAAAQPEMEEKQIREEKGFEKSIDLPGLEEAETSVADAVGVLTGAFPLLGPILSQLPANPGIHFGVIQTKDDGPQLFFSARFKFKAETHDRSPRFVSKGTIRLQVMTAAAGEGQRPGHYIKVIWCGRASAAELSLANRPVSRFPLGLGIGVAPSMSPILYSAGLSYKVMKGLEIYAGAGFRAAKEDVEEPYSRTSFVYGLTLDVQSVIGIISKAVGKEDY